MKLCSETNEKAGINSNNIKVFNRLDALVVLEEIALFDQQQRLAAKR